jgi:hypothetical protein
LRGATDELPGVEPVEVGEQLIDIAEYYGSTELESATLVRYMQLKHSTLRVDEIWQPSGLDKTIRGFAERFEALQKELPDIHLCEKLEFWFVTNRPITADFIVAIEDAAAQSEPRHPGNLKKLETFTSLDGEALATFCRMLRLDGTHDNYWTQRNILFQDVSGYLPNMDVDSPIRLKELVNRKALSESAANPAITKMDVLRELRTDESQLFPAPCLIEEIAEVIPRQQEQAIIRSIIEAAGSLAKLFPFVHDQSPFYNEAQHALNYATIKQSFQWGRFEHYTRMFITPSFLFVGIDLLPVTNITLPSLVTCWLGDNL